MISGHRETLSSNFACSDSSSAGVLGVIQSLPVHSLSPTHHLPIRLLRRTLAVAQPPFVRLTRLVRLHRLILQHRDRVWIVLSLFNLLLRHVQQQATPLSQRLPQSGHSLQQHTLARAYTPLHPRQSRNHSLFQPSIHLLSLWCWSPVASLSSPLQFAYCSIVVRAPQLTRVKTTIKMSRSRRCSEATA